MFTRKKLPYPAHSPAVVRTAGDIVKTWSISIHGTTPGLPNESFYESLLYCFGFAYACINSNESRVT